MTDLYISPEIIDKDDATMLQETIIAAFNGALKMVKDFKDSSMQDITKGMDLPTNIPGLF